MYCYVPSPATLGAAGRGTRCSDVISVVPDGAITPTYRVIGQIPFAPGAGHFLIGSNFFT